jgi:MFS transporter, MHS family, shikimate and dehydroshikimate transport protein
MDRTRGEEVERQGSPIGRVALASLTGTTMKWYDFFLYGTAAALIFNQLFFSSFEPLAGTLASFATFAVGFFARPTGRIFFGHFGDRIGRRSILIPLEERRRAIGEPEG